jgi:LysM repeat protein
VAHRLKSAGYDGAQLFSEEALDLIADASQGIPRTINNLCFNALALSYAVKRTPVDGRIAAEAISKQQLISVLGDAFPTPAEVAPVERKRPWLLIPAFSVLLILVGLGFRALSGSWSPKSYKMAADAKVLPGPVLVTAPSAVTPDKTVAVEPAPEPLSIPVTVEPHQTLSSIAVEYIGNSDLQSIQQIKTLNPKLVDADHIEPGQVIWLPAQQHQRTKTQ